MAKFVVAFRLKDNSSYDDRYESLVAVCGEVGTAFWEHGTSLIALETSLGIAALGGRLKACVSPSTDFVMIREIDVKNTAYVGEPGDGFLYFFPDAKKL